MLSRGHRMSPPVGTPATGGQEIKANDEGFGLSFFLHRLTDEALMEGFSDYSDLIAWGKHFLVIPCLSRLASRALPSHCRQQGHGLAQGMVPHGTALRFCQDLRTSSDKQPVPMAAPLPAACLGEPLGAGSTHPPYPWPLSTCGLWWSGCPQQLLVPAGLSLGDFQHCSFHFSAAEVEAYGRLKGINDA